VRERLFRGDLFEHERSRREDFDPIAEGKRYGLAPEVSAALWEHVRREATNSDGLCDENAARARFAQLAELIAGRGGQLGPSLSTGHRSMWRCGAYRQTTSVRSACLEGPRWSWPRRRLVRASRSVGFRGERR